MPAITFQLAMSAWSARERHAITLAHHTKVLVVGGCAVGGGRGWRRWLVVGRHRGTIWDGLEECASSGKVVCALIVCAQAGAFSRR